MVKLEEEEVGEEMKDGEAVGVEVDVEVEGRACEVEGVVAAEMDGFEGAFFACRCVGGMRRERREADVVRVGMKDRLAWTVMGT